MSDFRASIFAQFEAFNMEDKIKDLQANLGDASQEGLNGQHVVIAVPGIDESLRSIYSEDRALFHAQRTDAYVLGGYIRDNMGAEWISIITDFSRIGRLADRLHKAVDCAIFLHEFMVFEKNEILEELVNHSPDLKYFELY